MLAQGEIIMAPKVSMDEVLAAVMEETYTVLPDGRTTVCQLTLKNGFTVLGTSACVSKENFDPVQGNKYSRERALDQVWMLLGYDLQNKIDLVKKAAPIGGRILSLGSVVKHTFPPTTYVGSKVVHAVPMNRQEYNDLRGWTLPADERPDDEGYLVQYADGGDSNVEGFTGYISWSPKAVFERAYQPIIGVAAQTETFIDRLRKEHAELQERISKLGAFLMSPKSKALSDDALADLRYQLEVMEPYLGILTRRLDKLTAQQ